MSNYVSEGTIYIPLIDLWAYVGEHYAPHGVELEYGVPRVENDDLVIDFASACAEQVSPKDWMVKPKAIQQWEEKAAKS